MQDMKRQASAIPTGSWLAHERQRLGKTLGDVAQAVHGHVATVRALEQNNRVIPPGWYPNLRKLGMHVAEPAWPVQMKPYCGKDLNADLQTDFSLNYSFRVPVGGRDIEMFIQPEVINVFNADDIISTNVNFFNTAIFDATNTGATSCANAGPTGGPGRCRTFNPFTETPVEGIHWNKRPTDARGFNGFGTATTPDAYQTARTYRFSVGIRF